jgi:diamine N-acetyltransferase
MTTSTQTQPTKDSVLTLREVTKETVRDICRLKPSPHQERFVAPNSVSIAQAYFQKEAWFRGIYADDTPVGFLMLEDWSEVEGATPELYNGAPYVYLWRFMVDARYQGLGFGRRALEAAIARAKTKPGVKQMLLSYVPGEGSPDTLYRACGFEPTGEVEHGEHVMRITWE